MDALPSMAFARVSFAPDDSELCESYLAAVAWMESLDANRNGADKTRVEQAIRDSETHFAKAERIR